MGSCQSARALGALPHLTVAAAVRAQAQTLPGVLFKIPVHLSTMVQQLVLPASPQQCTLSKLTSPCCADSPQWRRGPTSKPILCNACGTRFRRTHQLLHLYGPSGIRKTPGSPCSPRKRAGEARTASKRVPALLRRASSCSTNSVANIGGETASASPLSANMAA